MPLYCTVRRRDLISLAIAMSDCCGSLWDAFGRPATLAFVGGGGQTTLGFHVLKNGAAAGYRALFTTTTRIRLPRVPEQVDVLVEDSELREAIASLRRAFEGHQRVALVTSREMSAHGVRGVGVPTEWIEILMKQEQIADLCVIEADGSRMLPFKAPRVPMEPVLPKYIGAVVAVAGLDALGVPLDEDHVCRADVVAKLTHLQQGDPVTALTIGKVLGDRDLWCHALESPVPFHVVVNKA